MPVTGWEFVSGKFQDVEYLIKETDELFRTKIVPIGGQDQFGSAVSRIIEHRRWQPSSHLIEAGMEEKLRQLGVFYVPKQLQPGPCFCFPSTDASGNRTRARISPFGWQLVIKGEVAKYGQLGLRHEFRGPQWLGDSPEMVNRMVKLGRVALVEGPFDMLACHLVSDMPCLTSGTKSLNQQHYCWLKIMGVNHILLLLDNDPQRGSAKTPGKVAQDWVSREAAWWGIKTTETICPAKDPSACLEDALTANRLKNLLDSKLRRY